MKKRTARITVETERLLVISRSKGSMDKWCGACEANSKFVGMDAAATVAGVSERTIFRWADAESIHLIETAGGKAMFCLNSIMTRTASNSRRLLRS